VRHQENLNRLRTCEGGGERKEKTIKKQNRDSDDEDGRENEGSIQGVVQLYKEGSFVGSRRSWL
jgi:hypothetical protein